LPFKIIQYLCNAMVSKNKTELEKLTLLLKGEENIKDSFDDKLTPSQARQIARKVRRLVQKASFDLNKPVIVSEANIIYKLYKSGRRKKVGEIPESEKFNLPDNISIGT